MRIEQHRQGPGYPIAHGLEQTLGNLAVRSRVVTEGRSAERRADGGEEGLTEWRPAEHVDHGDAAAPRHDGLRQTHDRLGGGGIVDACDDMPEGTRAHAATLTGRVAGGPAAVDPMGSMVAMGLRKRFLVVVVGVPGSPAEAQRSEVGRFRSDGAAQQAGTDEWRRILFVHAPHVDRYRIVIEADGVEVGEVPMPELPADTAPGILDESVTPLGASIGALGEPIEPEPEPEPETGPEPQTEPEPQTGPPALEATGELEVVGDDAADLAATGEHKGLAAEVGRDGGSGSGDDAVARDPAARPYLQIEDPPDGPVPDDIIQRFAAMVQAEEERAAERATRERDAAD